MHLFANIYTLIEYLQDYNEICFGTKTSRVFAILIKIVSSRDSGEQRKSLKSNRIFN